MEKNHSLMKNILSNYLRELYVQLSPEELKECKLKWNQIKDKASWCMIVQNFRLFKGILSYYLISKNCPEYQIYTTLDLVDLRFSDERIQDIIAFKGILIVRHSSSFIRNKLMFETLLNIVSEREYKGAPTIVVSNIAQDQGDHMYYSHEQIQRVLSCESIVESSGNRTTSRSRINSRVGCSMPQIIPGIGSSNKPYNAKKSREQEIKSRMQSIEGGANAV